MHKIQSIMFFPDFTIQVVLSDGEQINYNLKTKLLTARFKGIEKWENFNKGKVVGDYRICWGYGIELTLAEMMNDLESRKKEIEKNAEVERSSCYEGETQRFKG